MGQFIKTFFASCLGIVVGLIALFALGGLIFGIIAQRADQPQEVEANPVLKIKLDDPIPEKTNNLESVPLEFDQGDYLGMRAIIETIQRAKEDDNIKGIYLDLPPSGIAGSVTVRSLREALLDFKESGKFILAYGKFYSQNAYHLASVADEIMMHPSGILNLRGVSAQIPLYKPLFDKLGIDAQVFYAGKFKGASEPYRLENISDENRFQIRQFISQRYELLLEDISSSRNIDKAHLRNIIDQFQGAAPDDALANGLVDSLAYQSAATQRMRDRIGLSESEEVAMINLPAYHRSNPPSKNYRISDKIAILYAEGAIIDGKGNPGVIGDQKYIDLIQDIRENEDIKAIVLRVNSPGGSAVASENIWRELKLAQEAGKPVVVSMGDYAASGGYFISAGADSIFAEPGTLTGSIGVVAFLPNLQELMEEKIGIKTDTVKTGDFATDFSPLHELTPAQKTWFQSYIDSSYSNFLGIVSQGRGMPKEAVNEVAQGRVWTGEAAIDKGLVDRLGGIDEALASAATLAGIEEYRTSEYPSVPDPFQQFIQSLMGDEATLGELLLQREIPAEYRNYYRALRTLKKSEGVQARLPFVID